MKFPTLIQFFTDPILRAPAVGSMFMCLASSLIGVITFVQRRSLIGEALSHATYPGVISGILISALWCDPKLSLPCFPILIGAFLFSWLGLIAIEMCERRLHLNPDASLCLILSLFLGLGVTLASRIQAIHPFWYQQGQAFLFGQAATMGDVHIGLYATLSLAIVSLIVCRFRQIELIYFDLGFTQSLGLSTSLCHFFNHFLLILALVIGMRSVGIVLMSGMLIAPAACARQFTDRLGSMFIISATVGILSGFFGVHLSVCIPLFLCKRPLHLPTGPMIILVAVLLTFLSLLFAPKRGWLARMLRIRAARLKQQMDHLLKVLWKRDTAQASYLRSELGLSRLSLYFLLLFAKKKGWIRTGEAVTLTTHGRCKGAYIVRLHRLWELYLTSQLELEERRVHRSAEEMEHILTPEIEERLTQLLNNPTRDPHHQPIPRKGDT